VQLVNDDALRSVDDKGPAGRHEGNVPHVDRLLPHLHAVLPDEPYGGLQGRRIGHIPLLRLELRIFRLADLIVEIFEHDVLVGALDGEYFLEHGLKPLGLLLDRARLEEPVIGLQLNFYQIGQLKTRHNLAKINDFF